MPIFQSRSRLGNAVKKATRQGVDPATDPDVADARRCLVEDQITDYVKKVVDGAPPLTPDQLARLQALFTTEHSSDGSARGRDR
ncbi:hypothetical protein N865_19960 [Intrasporangium oryzae NRRL B-24470]|uniref:Uncharacterized protein n=1 Tax=Intrasporangium oryzae NRRL B-24470 TaxID=1386089 RepID=W9G7M8_9MICO|nr:hypothetical protein [Intrasporangium oryzae]EWS99878.1 hypothetical protein N865_19960 [Intrasporangium oryzae NRRL B-24470]